MSKRKFLHSRYSPLFLALAAVFSSTPAVCEARVTIAAGHEQTTIPVDTALSDNTLKDGNGAAVSNAGTVGSIGTADSEFETMSGNNAVGDWNNVVNGGAVFNTGTIDAIYAHFENNRITTASGWGNNEGNGGAIYNEGTIGQIGQTDRFVTFGQNVVDTKKTGRGGAISNASGSRIDAIYADFSDNYADYAGAINNEGTIGQIGLENRHSQFRNNNARGNASNTGGGAIHNRASGNITAIYADFHNNTVGTPNSSSFYGGAIANNGVIATIQGTFQENAASGDGYGGAIYNGTAFTGTRSAGTINLITNSQFIENRAANGGAIYNNDNSYGKNQISAISGSTFQGNAANATNAGAGGAGGAIYNLGAIGQITGSTFTENSASSYGGAIHTEGTIDTISGTRFVQNSAYEGGAINNDYTITNISGSTFENNTADWGGALSNYGTIGNLSDNTFTGNTATGKKGGAIYNNDNGTITFSGMNTFSGNTAAGKPNDITNEGTLNFGAAGQEHKKTAIGSGIDGNGEMNLNSGELEIAGGRTVEQKKAAFAGGTNVLVTVGDGNRILDGHAASASEVENLASQKDKSIIRTTGGLNIADGARLTVTGANAGKTYLIAVDEGGNVRNAGDGWKDGNLIDSSNVLLDFQRVEGDTETGTVMVTSRARDAREVLPCVDIPDNLNALVSGQKIDVDSSTAGIRFLSRATDSRYMPGGRTQMEEVINSASQIATAGAVRNITYSGAGMFNRAVEKHLSLSRTLQLGDAVRLHEKEHADLWVDLIGMHQRNHGMPVCSGKECGDRTRFGHRIDMGGIVAGIDRSFDANRHAGIALMAGTGSASSKGDFSHTKNDVDFWGASLYGGYDRDNWNVMGNVSYTHFDSDIDQTLPATLQMGNKLRADISSHQWSAGIRGEYRIRFDNGFDLLPHAGLRYDRLVMSGFRTKADAGSVFSTKKDTMNIYSLPVGAGIQGTFRNRNGWTFTPQADLTAIFAAGDIRDRTEVSAAGLDATDSIHTRIVDRTSIMAGIGFDMQKGNKSFGLHYDAMYSSRQMWQGLMAKVILRFE